MGRIRIYALFAILGETPVSGCLHTAQFLCWQGESFIYMSYKQAIILSTQLKSIIKN